MRMHILMHMRNTPVLKLLATVCRHVSRVCATCDAQSDPKRVCELAMVVSARELNSWVFGSLLPGGGEGGNLSTFDVPDGGF